MTIHEEDIATNDKAAEMQVGISIGANVPKLGSDAQEAYKQDERAITKDMNLR